MFATSLRNSQLEVLVDGREWHRMDVSLEDTALVLSPVGDGFVDVMAGAVANETSPNWIAQKRTVRIVKREEQGLGISIQGGAEGGKPIIIRCIPFL